MGVNRYLKVKVDSVTYLCPEENVHRVVNFDRGLIYESPYGPDWLANLVVYEKEVIPFLNIRECEKKSNSKTKLAVIIKKILFFIAIEVDEVLNFVEIGDDIIDTSLNVVKKFAKRTFDYEGEECYILDIDALFSGKE